MKKDVLLEKPPLMSHEVIDSIKDNLQNSFFATTGFSLDDKFFGFKYRRYKMFLTRNEPVDENNIALVMPYLLDRIPTELLSTDKNIELVLTNDVTKFQDCEDIKTAKSRRRWYTIEDQGDKRVIYWHIRDDKLIEENDLVGGTDAIEMMSFLSLLHILRKSDFNVLEQKFEEIGYLMPNDKFDAFHNEESFIKWKYTDFNVKLDFDVERPSAVDILVQNLKDRLPKPSNGEKKPFLLIGNDFSWRLTMFSLFLNGENLNKLKEKYANDLSLLNRFIEESQLGEKEDLREFIKKYFLLTLLNKEYKHNEDLTSIYDEIFSAENYQKLGYRRLLYGKIEPINKDENSKRSITGEPVDYWDPNSFDEQLLQDETNYVRKLFEELLTYQQPILSIPYLNGKISPELIVKLIKAGLVDESVVGFLGKVGYFDSGTIKEPLRRGNIVMPVSVSEITRKKPSNEEYPHKFSLDERDLHFINLVRTAKFTTTPAVTIQSEEDFKNGDYTDSVLESEQYYIVEKFEENNLATRIIGSFYISDISRKNPIVGAQDNINIPLTPQEGAISVCLTTLFEIDQIIKFRKRHEEKKKLAAYEKISQAFLGLLSYIK